MVACQGWSCGEFDVAPLGWSGIFERNWSNFVLNWSSFNLSFPVQVTRRADDVPVFYSDFACVVKQGISIAIKCDFCQPL